jgi:hypothetical protein
VRLCLSRAQHSTDPFSCLSRHIGRGRRDHDLGCRTVDLGHCGRDCALSAHVRLRDALSRAANKSPDARFVGREEVTGSELLQQGHGVLLGSGELNFPTLGSDGS